MHAIFITMRLKGELNVWVNRVDVLQELVTVFYLLDDKVCHLHT